VVLERLRAATPAGRTCSIGLGQWDGSEPAERLIARVDAALYAAKQAGRDRVVTASS
jgi:PleD family two-component response regulator